MNITKLIDELTEILNEHGDIPVGYDDYNCGYGGTQEVESVYFCAEETMIGDRTSQPIVRLT